MKSLLVSIVVVLSVLVRPAVAQQGADIAWVQIEAHPSLRVAQQRASLYADALPDVNGFALGGNWYGIVLGPYTRPDAERALQVYRSRRQIPQDSFLAYSSNLGQQFWPVGADVLNSGTVAAPEDAQTAPDAGQATPDATAGTQADAPDATTPETADTAPATPGTTDTAIPQLPDESPAEARRSERALDAQQRMDIQVALQAAGFYNSAIDGAFGAGTRRSMADWQAARGYEATGVLTTAQRQALMDEYNAPLISVGMAEVEDSRAGIRIALPTKEVAFARYEAPFAQYDASGELGARVLLISQPGDRATLFGLYDIMQTLEIVPLDGPRNRTETAFTLEGRGSSMVSHTEAALQDGQIKGFTLIWPVDDEERRTRVLAAMRSSFTRLPGVLDPASGTDATQAVDLMAGLAVRKPRMTRSGVYVDGSGSVLTAAGNVAGCTRITLDDTYDATVASSDAARGLAVLRPAQPLAPIAVARISAAAPRLQSDIAVSGYSYEGVLGAPSLTFGKLVDTKGLQGESDVQRLAIDTLPGDAGGPVLDAAGHVVGLLLPAPGGDRQLPEGVNLAADATRLRAALEAAGIASDAAPETGAVPPAELTRMADGMTVQVSCWDN